MREIDAILMLLMCDYRERWEDGEDKDVYRQQSRRRPDHFNTPKYVLSAGAAARDIVNGTTEWITRADPETFTTTCLIILLARIQGELRKNTSFSHELPSTIRSVSLCLLFSSSLK